MLAAADVELPTAQSSPVVDRAAPAPRGLVFLAILFGLAPLELNDKCQALRLVADGSYKIGRVVMLHALELVGNGELQVIVLDIARDYSAPGHG